MKNYVGVKIVKAEPQDKNGRPGYQVKYPDGYESWRMCLSNDRRFYHLSYA